MSYKLALNLLTAQLITLSSLGAPGDLYQADFGSGSVFRYSPTGAKTTFATGLGSPAGLAFDPKGNLFVANNSGGSIVMITPAGAKTTFAVGLNKPFGLAFDANGNLYEADEGGGVAFKFSPTGTKTTFASGLSSPAGLAFDLSGNLYVSNFTGNRIDKVTPDGTRTTFATGLSFPNGLSFTPFGNLLQCDSGSGSVFLFSTAGAKTLFANGFFQNPGVIMDEAGNAFVTQNAAGTITKIGPAGSKTTFASGLFNPQYLAFEPPNATLTSISTRLFISTGNNVLIGGFTIHGTAPKPVLVRVIGPSLSQFGITNALPDPTLGLHSTTSVIASNDDWQSASNAAQIPANLRPTDPRESAILITLAPGNYTAVGAGKNNAAGVGLIQVFDLDTEVTSEVSSISMRGFVQTGDNVMIGGFTNSGGNNSTEVVVRAIGPTLQQFGITNPLADPVLQLFDANGNLVASNDNWKTTQQALIQGTGLGPPNDLESAILITVPNAAHTAIVSGKNGATGVALVEVYQIR
jgi:sugar lactone lactonase YvrE